MLYPKFLASLVPTNISVQRCLVPRNEASIRIIIVKQGALGDILMATPLVSALRQAYPNAFITWLVEHTNVEAVDANPHIDEVIIWDSNYWRDLLPSRWKKWLDVPRRWFGLRWLTSALIMAHQLRQRRFDVFLTLSAHEWPLLVVGARAPLSIGLEETDDDCYKRFYKIYLGRDLPTHRTDKYLCMLEAMDLPSSMNKQMIIGYTASDAAAVNNLLEQHDISHGKPFVVLAPQTTWLSKNWSPIHYAALADRLTRDHGCRVVLTGTERECLHVEAIGRMMNEDFVSTAGLLSIRQMSALIDKATLVISGDTGPMHIAAAVGTPYVALFGPTNPAHYAPLSGRGITLAHPVPCGPCESMLCKNLDENYILCMRLLSVEKVFEAATVFLTRGAS